MSKFEFTDRGSVSTGTLKATDLVPVFTDLAMIADPESVTNYYANRVSLAFWSKHHAGPEGTDKLLARQWATSPKGQEMLDEAVEWLIDKINYFCPVNVYFGAHPGDGADFGFWEVDEDEDEGEDEDEDEDVRPSFIVTLRIKSNLGNPAKWNWPTLLDMDSESVSVEFCEEVKS